MKGSSLKGSHGYLLVADGTRGATLEIARELRERAFEAIGPVPFILVLNKTDLTEQWELEEASLDRMIDEGWEIIRSSARTGSGVEEAFTRIASLISSE